mgnify:CR=1 FL=1
MEFENLLIEQSGHVAILTIARPPVNALNSKLLVEIFGAIGVISRMEGVRALVVTGQGKAFVAGADIAEMENITTAEASQFAARGQAVFSGFEALEMPVIAAVNGFALGGGCELAMACDLILAGPKALFGQPEVKLGVIPGFGGTQRLSKLVGIQRARELCFTGRNVRADEAVSIGLALKLCDDVVASAVQMGEAIAKNGPYAVTLTKRAFYESEGAAPGSGYALERNLFAMCFGSEDQSEGMAAFLSKREAQFTGR